MAEVEDAALKREHELLRAFAEKVKQSKREREDMESHVAYVKSQLSEMLDRQDEEYTGEMRKLRDELEASKHKDIQLRVDAKGKRLELEVRGRPAAPAQVEAHSLLFCTPQKTVTVLRRQLGDAKAETQQHVSALQDKVRWPLPAPDAAAVPTPRIGALGAGGEVQADGGRARRGPQAPAGGGDVLPGVGPPRARARGPGEAAGEVAPRAAAPAARVAGDLAGRRAANAQAPIPAGLRV